MPLPLYKGSGFFMRFCVAFAAALSRLSIAYRYKKQTENFRLLFYA